MAHDTDAAHDDIIYPSAIPFVLVHLACFAAIWTGVTWQAVAIGVTLYWLRIFAIGAGYHRYFSHRAYSTSRAFQFILAVLATSTAQKSVLWWAAKHRHHHLHSDTEQDVHSPRHRGFLYSHVGWIFSRRHDATDLVKIADFARYPELMWLHRLELLPPIALAIVCYLLAGWPGLVVGFFWSTVAALSRHLLHQLAGARARPQALRDRRRFAQQLAAGILHHGRRLAQQSPRLPEQRAAGLPMVGGRHDLLHPEGPVLARHRLGPEDAARTGAAQRAAARRAGRQSRGRTTGGAVSTPSASRWRSRPRCMRPELSALRERLARAHDRATEMLSANLSQTPRLPQMPTREDFLAEAKAMFAKTPSLEEIAERAHDLLLAAVGRRLLAPIEQQA